MRNFLALLCFVFSFSARAQLYVGDSKVEETVMKCDGEYDVWQGSSEVISRMVTNDDVVIRTRTMIKQSTGDLYEREIEGSESLYYDGRSLRDPKNLKKLCLKHPEFHPAVETVSVWAGSFLACKWTDDRDPHRLLTMWYGAVPFGFIKSEYYWEGCIQKSELRSFKFAGE